MPGAATPATPAASAATAAPSATASTSQPTVSAALGDRLRRSTAELVVEAGDALDGERDPPQQHLGLARSATAATSADERSAVSSSAQTAVPRGRVPALVPTASASPSDPAPTARRGALAGLGRLGGLACYGGERIELCGFTPTACGAGGSPRSGTPEWLNGTWTAVGIGAFEPVPPDFEVRSR